MALLVVFAAVAALYARQALDYFSARSQADAQRAIALRLERQDAQLERQQRSLANPATIKADARALGMVLPGERPYVVTGLPRG